MNFESWFQKKYSDIPLRGASVVIKLVEDGSTLPFIARYRKEQTGNLDEVAIQRVIDAKTTWDEVEKRKTFILSEIESQGKLSDELRQLINNTYELSLLEDIYLPFKKKRKTKATTAKEAGLEPLAEWIWRVGHGDLHPDAGTPIETHAAPFIDLDKGVPDVAAALEGAHYILVERLSEMPELRQFVRNYIFEHGFVVSEKWEQAKENSKFANFFEFHESITSLMNPQNSHRYLALRRGEAESEIRVTIGGKPGDTCFDEPLLARFEAEACPVTSAVVKPTLRKAARFALKYHVLFSSSSEVHAALKEVADEAAIKVFADNLRTVLLASPFGAKTVLGVDPGIRTGCKIALVDQSGTYVTSTVMFIQSEAERLRTTELLRELTRQTQLQAIAVGNGTASRETENFLRDTLKSLGLSTIPVVVVSESGASIYSASETARLEFPDLDVTVRGAISIARRLQDPLAELVKVDPKSIGVGQYQHDVSPSALKNSLQRVVESCVNSVGVNLNTASEHLLAYVSGIGSSLARSIIEFRSKNGLFSSRKQLLEVPRFGAKAFEQAAGFLRIPGGAEPLDNTGVHPERYEVLYDFAKRLGKSVESFLGSGSVFLRSATELRELVGEFTFADIISELEKPGRDPREQFVPFQFLDGIHELSDLKPGMLCPGVVTNVTNFGAFVDIGVHQDGLVHISQLSDRFVKDPKDVVGPGDRVQVRVLEVNIEKKQIALSMKTETSSPRTKEASKVAERARGPGSQTAAAPGNKSHSPNKKAPALGDRRGKIAPSTPDSPFAGLKDLYAKAAKTQ